jgi:hypothetical protein
MALNFADIASKKVEDVERPPLPPVGTYRWKVTKLPEQTKRGQDDQWDVVEFAVQAQEAYDNVDMDDYKGDVTGIFNRVTFMFDTTDEAKFEQTLYRLRTFLERHLRCSEEGMSVSEALNASVGQEFLGDIKWRQDKNDQEMFYAEIGKTAPVE